MRGQERERLLWLDLLRIWSCFWVIVSHVQSPFYWRDKIGNGTWGGWMEQVIIAAISRFAVPCFIMISGVIWLHKGNDVSIKSLWKKRIPRLFTSLLFWSILYAIFTEWSNKKFEIYRFVKNVFCGNYHLWFLYMFIGVYTVIPLIQYISKSEKLFRYLLVLSGIFTSVIPTMKKIPILEKSQIFNYIFNTINFKFALGGVFYVMLGHFLDDYVNNCVRRRALVVLGGLSLLITILLGRFECIVTQTKNFNWFDYYALNIILYSIGVFSIFKKDFKLPQMCTDLISKVSKLSFGIYLIHDFYKVLLTNKFATLSAICPKYILVFLISCLVFIASFITVWLINKIPKLNKYIL